MFEIRSAIVAPDEEIQRDAEYRYQLAMQEAAGITATQAAVMFVEQAIVAVDKKFEAVAFDRDVACALDGPVYEVVMPWPDTSKPEVHFAIGGFEPGKLNDPQENTSRYYQLMNTPLGDDQPIRMRLRSAQWIQKVHRLTAPMRFGHDNNLIAWALQRVVTVQNPYTLEQEGFVEPIGPGLNLLGSLPRRAR